MKSYLIREHGGLERLELIDAPEPEAGTDAAVVAVRAVALNHLDLWVRRGVPGHTFPLPLVPGAEASGVIESAPAASPWKAGDEVIISPAISCGTCVACTGGNDPLCRTFGIRGESADGVLAERIAVPARYLLRKPPELSFAEAAAFPLDFLTAWHMLVARAQVRPGETVLVQAGGSGVGSAAVQIARMWGAKVITTVGSAEKAGKVRQLGADHVIAYRETDFAAEVRSITGKRGVDVVIEHVGGETFERSLRVLARGGRLITCGATSGAEVSVNLRLIFFKLLSIIGSTMGSLSELHEIIKHVEAGRLRPVIDRILPFGGLAEGHRILEERQAFGKIVLSMDA
jgi:NADPH:quinone reductase-like Zn-dependent oxidoreductase